MRVENITLQSVRSHYVQATHYRGGEREELYPTVTADVRGQTVTVELEASRYVASYGDNDDRWTPWRVFIRRVDGRGVGEATRAALRDACVPRVEAWLDSDAYRASRARAYASMIRRELRDERYSADRPRKSLAENRSELTDADAERLSEACDTLERFLTLTDT